MRIASAYHANQSIANLQQRQQQLSETQAQMTSGKRVAKASDDPADAARAERALALVKRNEATLRAVEAARTAMTLTEGAMGDAQDMTQTARETLVQLGNGSYTDSDRDALVLRLQDLRAQMLAVANRQDASGHYLFGAQGASTAPFVDDGAGNIIYNGTSGDMQGAAHAGEPLPLTVDGGATWDMGSGADVFATLKTAIDRFSIGNPTSAQLALWTGEALSGMDSADAAIQASRTQVGESLNRIDGVQARLATLNVSAEGDRSNATDLDLVQALSAFQTQQTGYDAALKAYASVQRMSLFQYINP